MHKILYLTSELTNRDWDTRLLMADHAVNAGYSVVIGQQWQVLFSLQNLPRGLLMIKTMNQIQGNAVAAVRQMGHLVAVMDEESLPLATDEDIVGAFLAKGYSEPAVKYSNVFLANSPLHKACIEKTIPGLQGKIIVTGNPRVDLLTAGRRARYAATAEAVRAKHGRFILFNSNTASRNSIWSKKEFLDIQVRAGALDVNNAESVALFQEQLDFEEANARIFEAMLTWCAAHATDHTIVVRPHPSEGREYWDTFAAENPNVQVVWGTPHVPYMMAADLVVHTNCTTGIEAAILDRPSLNLMPMPNSYWAKIYFASKVSPTFNDLESAQGAVRTFLQTGGGPLVPNENHRAELHRYFPCVVENTSAANMVGVMMKMLSFSGAQENPTTDAIVQGLTPYRLEGTARKKFSKSAEEAVADFNAIRSISGMKRPLSFTPIADSLFLLQPQPG